MDSLFSAIVFLFLHVFNDENLEEYKEYTIPHLEINKSPKHRV